MKKHLALLLVVLALVAAACGGGGDEASGVASLEGDGSTNLNDSAAGPDVTVDDVDPEEAMLALTQCLREQGVDIEDPTVDAEGNPQLSRPNFGDGGPTDGFRDAMQSCQSEIEGVTLGRGRSDLTEVQDELLEFAACVRDNGYDMPDPDLTAFGSPGQGSGPGQGGGIFGELDFEDPSFQSALEACEDILAGFGPGGGAGPGGGRLGQNG